MKCLRCKGTGIIKFKPDAPIHAKLKMMRKNLELTLGDVEKRSGVSKNTIFAIENYITRKPSLRFVEKICKVYKLNVEEL